MVRRVVWRALAGVLLLAACESSSGPSLQPRGFRMGFSNIPPRPDSAIAIQTLNLWIPRSDAAIMHLGVPWGALLADTAPAVILAKDIVPLANGYRSVGLRLVVTIDVTDGLNRAKEAPELITLGRSITDTVVQRRYREWAVAVAQALQPDYLGLAAETNLIKAAAPDSVYQAMKTMTNAAAPLVRAAVPGQLLYVSVQVEVAWGRPSGSYAGIAQDLTDFPFMDVLGLSSYPFLGGFAEPESLPLDYYSRLGTASGRPVLVVEGGWTSDTSGGFNSSPDKQARYLIRQQQLLDGAGAVALFQLTFTDLDLSAYPPLPPGSSLPLFTHLGLVDSALNAKPALTAWDVIFARPFRP